MSNPVNFGVTRKRMMRDASEGSMVNASMNVPREFLETAGRKKFNKLVSILELIAFCVTSFIVAVIVFYMTFPQHIPEGLAELEVSLVIIPLFLLNLMGTFIKSASEGAGVNWCARGIGLMFAFLGGGFVLNSIL